MTPKIYTGARAVIRFSDGTKFEVKPVDVSMTIHHIEAVDVPPPLPRHRCRDCGNEWTLSTNDDECMCGGRNVEHQNCDPPKCKHDWKHYRGIMEEYDYCTKCDTKRNQK